MPARAVPVAEILGVPVAMPAGDGRDVPVAAAVPVGEDIADGEGAVVPVSGVAVSSPESVHATSDKAARRNAMTEVSNVGGRLEVICGSFPRRTRKRQAQHLRKCSRHSLEKELPQRAKEGRPE
jgi:hypothetical protein